MPATPEGNRKIAERLKARDPDYFKNLSKKRKNFDQSYFSKLKAEGRDEELKALAKEGGKTKVKRQRPRQV